jgi:hypothetical protein
MFYIDADQNRYRLGSQFTYLGTSYGGSAATHAKFMELGFTQVLIQSRPDDRFYVVSGPNNAGEYDFTPRDLNQLKLGFIMEQKRVARQLLAPSDWYIIRKAETGTDPDPDWLAYRAEVRAAADVRCGEINDAASVEALETLIKAPGYLYNEETEEQEVNPAALTQFPDGLDEAAQVASGYGLSAGASGAY